MDKSPDAYRTISEVAEDLDLPQHVLRFWETRFSQIKPMKRGGGREHNGQRNEGAERHAGERVEPDAPELGAGGRRRQA